MRIAAISDVHGNATAFRRVLDAVRAQAPDRIVFCGDICGYYYRQREVIESLASLTNLTAVMGNHDRMFLDSRKDPEIMRRCVERYGRSYERLHAEIDAASLSFLEGLPDMIEEPGLAVYHGSPWNHLDEYVYPADDVARFADTTFPLILLGHTHRPMHRVAGDVNMVNPGSCGQPRDHNEACFAVVDTQPLKVSFHRVAYDVDAVMAEVARIDPDQTYLRDVLLRRPVGQA